MKTTRLWIGLSAVLLGCSSGNEAKPTGAASAVTSAPPRQEAPGVRGDVPPRLRSVIAGTLKIDESRVTANAAFAADLGADELSMVELVMAYEREFTVDIPNADADRFKQVQDVVSYLRQRNALR